MSTKVIAVVKDAGSAGATTTAVTLAALLAEAGRKVVLVDLDSQANATLWLGIDEPTATVGDVLLRRSELSDALVDSNIPGLRVLPASEELRLDRIELGRAVAPEQRLRQVLRDVDADVVIIDCQAGVAELLPVAALVAATSVITVAFPSPKELEGVPRVTDTIDEIADAYNPGLRLAAIVPCAVPAANSGRLYGDAVQALRDAYENLVTPTVRRSVTAAEAYDNRMALPQFAPTSPVTTDYREVIAHLLAGGVL